MEIKQVFATKNECYITNDKIIPKGIMIHSTGANNPNLRRYVQPDDGLLGKHPYDNHFNVFRPLGKQKCVHAFIGKLANGKVACYQTLPWTMRSWHAGTGKTGANNTHISFEVCEDDLKDKNYFNEIYKMSIELCIYLCKEFNLTEKTIIDHAEGFKQGIASNHNDITFWFKQHGKTMDMFRQEVKQGLEPKKPEQPQSSKIYRVQVGAYPSKESAEKAKQKLILDGYKDAFIV